MTEPSIFDEVREDLERQRLEDLWKRYGGLVVAFAVCVVLGTAFASGYRSWHAERERHLTAGLLQAEDAEPAQRLDALRAFSSAHPGTDAAVFAELRAGVLAMQAHDTAVAIGQFHAVAADAKADPAFRQLGQLLEVQAQLDTGDPKALAAALDPLAADDAPWQFSAMETQALLALRAGDKDRARTLLTSLTRDARVPRDLAARAGDILRGID